jgi:hypothetical protein
MSGLRMNNGGSFVADMQCAVSEVHVRRQFLYENLKRWLDLEHPDVWTDLATGCPTGGPCSDRGKRSFCCPVCPHWVRAHPVGTWSYFANRKATVPRLTVPSSSTEPNLRSCEILLLVSGQPCILIFWIYCVSLTQK